MDASVEPVSLRDQVLDFVDQDALSLGDRRRHRAYIETLLKLSHRPSLPLPERFEPSQLERHYRFVGNPHFTMKDLLDPLVSRARQQLERRPDTTAYVIHDTTRFSWKIHHDKPRLHLSLLSKTTQGFFAHTSTLVEAGSPPDPLGLLALQPFVHRCHVDHDEATLQFWVAQGGVQERGAERWRHGVEASAAALGPHAKRVIHLMDAETDDWFILSDLVEKGHRFICRLAQDRCIQPTESGAHMVKQALEHAPVRGQFTLDVQEREKSPAALKDKHPARQARTTSVEVRSCTVRVLRSRGSCEGPPELTLNLVQARERTPPAGEDPVWWILATHEPVESLEECMAVLRGYELRWLTEELYKALKTGCSYDDVQLESASSLLKELVLMLPVALSLLRLRMLAQREPPVEAQEMVSEAQLEVINTFVPRTRLTLHSPIHQVMAAIARLGGHLRGKIGWLVLGRGYMRLLEYERVWLAASLPRSQTDVL